MARRVRKQRVVLRRRRKEKLKKRFRLTLARGGIFLLAGACFVALAARGDSFFLNFLARHTPVLEVKAPASMAGLPIAGEWTKNRFYLWFPWTTRRLAARIVRTYSVVKAVDFERQWGARRIIARLEPRKPLVRWQDQGMDGDGVTFPIPADAWPALPKAEFNASVSPGILGRWLSRLSQESVLWSDVASVSDDSYGSMTLFLKTGAVILWGAPEPEPPLDKVRALEEALQDAHEHLGGAARADLRFFDEGRIIVRPKAVRP